MCSLTVELADCNVAVDRVSRERVSFSCCSLHAMEKIL